MTLAGNFVTLEPLALHHTAELAAVAFDPALWQWIPTRVTSEDELRRYVALALEDRAAGNAIPFAIRWNATAKLIGSTRFANIVPAHRRLEIGWSWIAGEFQRTAANTESKLLLLTHAFETLHFHRVEFKTDALNARSRAAIERLGAQYEGTFRKHAVTSEGRVRDTVYYAIIDTEWPEVKRRLQARFHAGD